MNAAHQAVYTGELREFSAIHGVPCGSCGDLRGLVVSLEAGGAFAEEFACMLRSVMYGERGEAEAGSLLRLVTRVWGGGAEAEQETVLALREFVCGAMRGPELGEAEGDGPGEASFAGQVVGPPTGEAEWLTPVGERAHSAMEIESAIRELEARSPEVRMYRELVNQREAALAAEAGFEREGGRVEAEKPCAFARGFDPWDESSELQQELRRFARHRERMVSREAEKASRPLGARLLGGAESVLGQLLGGSRLARRV